MILLPYSFFNYKLRNNQLLFLSSSFKIRHMVLGAIFISRDKIFCFWTGFLRILSLTSLIDLFVRTLCGCLDLFLTQTKPTLGFIIPINSPVHKHLTNTNRMKDFKNGFWLYHKHNYSDSFVIIISFHFNITKRFAIYYIWQNIIHCKIRIKIAILKFKNNIWFIFYNIYGPTKHIYYTWDYLEK